MLKAEFKWIGGKMIITLLRKERQKKGWTLDMVSTRIGIAIQTLHDIETGRRKPSYDVLLKLEDLFNLPHRQLFAAVVGEPTPAENEMPYFMEADDESHRVVIYAGNGEAIHMDERAVKWVIEVLTRQIHEWQ
jgi:transcriptional regulator with XRE-family HTH domain